MGSRYRDFILFFQQKAESTLFKRPPWIGPRGGHVFSFAIDDVRCRCSFNQFYSELFHELHHVYQRTVAKTVPFDSPATLLTYPEDFRNDAIRQYEDELLLSLRNPGKSGRSWIPDAIPP